MKNSPNTIAIIGTQGLPARYGGFETLAEQLLRYRPKDLQADQITVFCSSRAYPARLPTYLEAELKYIPLPANGVPSVLYDAFSMFAAIWQKTRCILLLGTSGAIALPLVRLFSRARIITNIDGVEWKRPKWGPVARTFLRLSTYLAIRFSHEVVTDNQAIFEELSGKYTRKFHLITYGGDHAISGLAIQNEDYIPPEKFALAISRIEPENNPETILDAFAGTPDLPLVYIGNWSANKYARQLLAKYSKRPHINLWPAQYDAGQLRAIREKASVYLHGHSVGGTNPSLVEMMHFGCPIVAFDCVFNRHTTQNQAAYFKTAQDLQGHLKKTGSAHMHAIGQNMLQIAQQEYVWDKIAAQYFDLLLN